MSPESFQQMFVIRGIEGWYGVGDSKTDAKNKRATIKEYPLGDEYVK
jgi:hypothetical protein